MDNKIYLRKLDIEYFVKCVEESVQDAKEYYGTDINGLKDSLCIIKHQCDGLRDVFWMFTADDIYRISDPVCQALNEIKDIVDED